MVHEKKTSLSKNIYWRFFECTILDIFQIRFSRIDHYLVVKLGSCNSTGEKAPKKKFREIGNKDKADSFAQSGFQL